MLAAVRSPLAVVLLTSSLLLAGAGVATAEPAARQATAADPATQPVDRYTAWQACRADVWRWAARNARIGTTVDMRLNAYSPALEARQDGGWFVQISGPMRQPVRMSDHSAFCVITGTRAVPRIAGYSYPR